MSENLGVITDDPEVEIEAEAAEVETIEADDVAIETDEVVSVEEADEVVISLDGDEPEKEKEAAAEAPQWVKDLRRTSREQARKIKEYEQRLSERVVVESIGEKPTLEKFDFDEPRYEAALAKWFDVKRAADARAQQARDAAAKQAGDYQEKLNNYESKKKELKVKDFDEAEHSVMEQLDPNQQGIIIQGSENPSHLIYALGKNDKRLKELSAIKDPVKFVWKLAQLEQGMKVTSRKVTTQPEGSVRGTGRTSGAVDSTLDRLRAQAAKSGNFTAVTAYLRKKKQ